MSRIRANTITNKAATGAPTFSNGAVVTGVCTATSFAKADGSAVGGNANGMQVLEEFFVPCNGTAVTMANGSVAIQNVTTHQAASDTLTDVNGSQITYQPPSGTKLVIYTMQIQCSYDSQNTILGFQAQLDGARVKAQPSAVRYMDYGSSLHYFQHGFRIESSADQNIGQVTSWNSTKTIKLQFQKLKAMELFWM